MKAIARLSMALTLLCISVKCATAEPLSVRIVGDESGFGFAVSSRLEALIKRAEPELVIEADHSANGRRVAVVVGAKGWRQMESIPADVPVLALLPPRQAFESAVWPGGRVATAVFADMPPTRLFNFVQLIAQKKGSVVGVIAGPATQWRFSRLESAAADRGLRIHLEKIDREAEAGPAVERAVQRSQLLLALPDPVAHTAGTVPPLLMIAYRAGVPVVGYSEAYLRAGAVAALYATPDQIAQQALEILVSYRQGKPLPSPQNLKYFTVGVNGSVARSLGQSLGSAEELESRLKAMHE